MPRVPARGAWREVGAAGTNREWSSGPAQREEGEGRRAGGRRPRVRYPGSRGFGLAALAVLSSPQGLCSGSCGCGNHACLQITATTVGARLCRPEAGAALGNHPDGHHLPRKMLRMLCFYRRIWSSEKNPFLKTGRRNLNE
ncbi:Hypothetical predicted protein [Marmota monax]|uniref:Uncharacterized protein n=1 Tax=Marmota monax TaxID=9995 RepID=A0A5E4BD60_MARMO|nr:Hypothetical predicted protein [Marmota monax]